MPEFKDYSENGELLQVRYEQLSQENLNRYIKVVGYEAACGYLDAVKDVTDEIETSFMRDYGGGFIHAANVHYIGKQNIADHTRRISFLSNAKKAIEKYEPCQESLEKPRPETESSADLIKMQFYIQQHGMLRARGYVQGVEDISKEVESFFTRVYESGFTEKSTKAYIGSNTETLFYERKTFLKSAQSVLSSFKIQ